MLNSDKQNIKDIQKLDPQKISLGICPIGWTNDDMPELGADISFEQSVSEMAHAGFAGTEIGGKFPKDADVLKKTLSPLGLRICNAWFSTYFTTKPEIETIEAFKERLGFLRELSAGVIGCSEQGRGIQGRAVPIFGNDKPVFSDGEWDKLCAGMNTLAGIAEEKGIKVCYHHHMGTGVQTPGEIDRFMRSVGADVGLLFDSGHIYFSEGTQEAVDALIDKYIDRIIHVHLKDVRADRLAIARKMNMSFLDGVRFGVFTVPGDGCINFDHIFSTLKAYDYKGWMLVEAEQDPKTANPLEYALKARGYLREKTSL